MSWLVSVGAGLWQIPGIRAAQRLGYKVLAVDQDPQAEGAECADIAVNCPFTLDAITDAISRHGIAVSGVAAFACDAGVPAADALAGWYGLTKACDNSNLFVFKNLQRGMLLINGVQQPGSVYVGPGEIRDQCDYMDRTIVKPNVGSGSRGVRVVNGDWPECARNAAQHSSDGAILVERFIDGTEYTIDGICCAGTNVPLLVMEKTEKRDFVTIEMQSVAPTSGTWELVATTAVRAVAALGMRSGPWHVEVIANASGAYVIEAAARGGGFGLWDYVADRCAGVRTSEMAVKAAVGSLDLREYAIRYRSTVVEFGPTIGGESLESFARGDLEPPRLSADIDGGSATVIRLWPMGAEMPYPSCDADRMYMLVGDGETLDLARAACDEVMAMVDIRTEAR